MSARYGLFLLLVATRAFAAATPEGHAAASLEAKPLVAPVTATATASKAEVSLGETFAVVVSATGPAGSTFAFPPAAVQDSFELHPAPPDSTRLAAGSRRYLARLFAIGDARLPPIPVRYRLADGSTGETHTAALPIHVASLLPKDKTEQKLADIHPPLGVAIGPLFWAGLSVAVLLLAALVWWFVSRRRKGVSEAVAVVPAVEPHEEARLALEALAASGRLARGEYRPFYIELTAIAKRYLERRLGAPIVEMTTAEMLAHLRSHQDASELAPTLRDLSGAADQIKFARGSGLTAEVERHLAATQSLIVTLEARFQPKPAPASPSEGGQAA